MTLADIFKSIGENPQWVLFYFTVLPFSALLAWWLGKGEGHISPWKYLYSVLLYLVSVPGIFSITLSIYYFLFEKRPILETDVYIQILPVISMVLTIMLARRNVDLDLIPGFEKLSGLIMVIFSTLAIMWVIDRTRIIVFSYLKFQYVILIFIGLLLVIRMGWKKLAS